MSPLIVINDNTIAIYCHSNHYSGFVLYIQTKTEGGARGEGYQMSYRSKQKKAKGDYQMIYRSN